MSATAEGVHARRVIVEYSCGRCGDGAVRLLERAQGGEVFSAAECGRCGHSTVAETHAEALSQWAAPEERRVG